MIEKNDNTSRIKTNTNPSPESDEDYYCMRCGGTLDERTKRCPRCDSPPAIHEENVPVVPKKESIPVVPTPPPPPSTGGQATEPVPPPFQKSPPRGISIKKIAIGLVVLFVVVVLALILIGLLNGSGGNSVLPVTPLSNTDNSQASRANMVPVPTDIVPPNTEVTVQVTKSPITQDISVIFSGGAGQNVLKELEIRVSRSDGQVQTTNLVPRQQSEATISGSKGDDRVEVFAVYYSGQKYRIFDEIMKQRVTI